MTNEGACNVLENYAFYLKDGTKYMKPEQEQQFRQAYEMAIKALKQESILDKIRAEIEQLTITKGGDDYVRKMAELFSLKIKVLQIIDKYKAESEEKG